MTFKIIDFHIWNCMFFSTTIFKFRKCLLQSIAATVWCLHGYTIVSQSGGEAPCRNFFSGHIRNYLQRTVWEDRYQTLKVTKTPCILINFKLILYWRPWQRVRGLGVVHLWVLELTGTLWIWSVEPFIYLS